MNKRTIAIVIVVLLLIGGTVWAFRTRSDPQLDKIRAMRDELFKGNGPPDPAKSQELWKEVGKLSDSQLETLREDRRRTFEQMENRQAAEFAKLPPSQRNDYLDKQLQEEERRRQEWERRRSQGQGQNGRGPGQNGGPPSQAGGPAGGGPTARPGGRRNLTQDQRDVNRSKRLDRLTPEQRAQRTLYRTALEQRRRELGLPQFPGRR